MAFSVITTALSLAWNKGRDAIAQRLRGGDVACEKFADIMTTDAASVSRKLDGLTTKALNTSILRFNEGAVELCVVLRKAGMIIETNDKMMIKRALENWNLTELGNSDRKLFESAKNNFERARDYATEALGTPTLRASGRIRAMAIRVAAKILLNIEEPENALHVCKQYLSELHQMSELQNNLKVAVKGGFRASIGRKERRQIISDVCQVNRAVYDLIQKSEKSGDPEKLHCVGSGIGQVDVLRDVRVASMLLEHYREYCPITPWQLSQDNLKMPRGITTNTCGQFIAGDQNDLKVKVFDSNGHCPRCFHLPSSGESKLFIKDVAIDSENNVYVLATVRRPTGHPRCHVYVSCGENDVLHHKFQLKEGFGGLKLTIDNHNKKVLILRTRSAVVDVYELTGGRFVESFGKNVLKDPSDISATNDGRVLVVDKDDSRVHVFSEQGNRHDDFKIKGMYFSLKIAPYRLCQREVVIAGKEKSKDSHLHFLIYNVTGELKRSIHLDGKDIASISAVTVTKKGHFAIVSRRPEICKAEEVLVV